MSTKEKLQQILTKAINIDAIEIRDDSHLHAGHQGAIESGGGHFAVRIVSADFKGKNLVARHRMVYAALKEEMKTVVHALAIEALTPEEIDAKP